MRTEAAVIMVLEIGSLALVFLLLPLLITLRRLPAVWRADRGTGLLLSGVVAVTAIFFALFFAGVYSLLF